MMTNTRIEYEQAANIISRLYTSNFRIFRFEEDKTVSKIRLTDTDILLEIAFNAVTDAEAKTKLDSYYEQLKQR